jgi:hypothetical protein
LSSAIFLLIPDSEGPIKEAASKSRQSQPFAWKQDDFWRKLETEFLESRRMGCREIQPRIEKNLAIATGIIEELASETASPTDPRFRDLEALVFQMTPWVAACPGQLNIFSDLVMNMRLELKRQSINWNLAELDARTVLYRLLYGGRAAVEEALLQAPSGTSCQPLIKGKEEPSGTPWASILGVKIHSGDILISRGGAATSALIARGNDYAGNFSHVALVYVHPKTHLASIIESHIERGVSDEMPGWRSEQRVHWIPGAAVPFISRLAARRT